MSNAGCARRRGVDLQTVRSALTACQATFSKHAETRSAGSGLTLPLRPRRTCDRSCFVDSLNDAVLGADVSTHPAYRLSAYVFAVDDRSIGRGITVLPYPRLKVGSIDIMPEPGPSRVRARRHARQFLGNRPRDAAGLAPDEVHIETGDRRTRPCGRRRVRRCVRAIRACVRRARIRKRDVMLRKLFPRLACRRAMDSRDRAIRRGRRHFDCRPQQD